MRFLADAIHTVLAADLKDQDFSRHSNPIAAAFAADYQERELLRKMEPVDPSAVHQQTFDSFLKVNNQCKNFELSTDPSMVFVEYAKSWLSNQFDLDNDLFLEVIQEGVDLGPGVNIGGHKSCSYPLKLVKGFSGTLNALRIMKVMCDNYGLQLFAGPNVIPSRGSKISFVPKSSTSSRMICTEPTANMFLQKGISRVIENILLKNGIDLSRQPERNQRRAWEGSINQEFVTIDLSSASDSISVKLIEYILPVRVVAWLKCARSPVSTYNGQEIELNMISTMGNGFTFSLQTLLFYAIARACSDDNHVDVFGDDIVVRKKYSARVLHVLELLGFTPNIKKTFVTGPFRESCGADYYEGVNVRPHYIKHLDSVQDLCVHINRLNSWCERLGFYLPRTSELFSFLVEHYKIPLVPTTENDDAGVKDPDFSGRTKYGQIRLDTYATYTGRIVSYYAYRVKPEQLYFTTKGVRGKYADEFRQLIESSPDLLISSFLRGTIRRDKLAFRSARVKYKLELVTIPVI